MHGSSFTYMVATLLTIGIASGCGRTDVAAEQNAAIAEQREFLDHLNYVDRIEFEIQTDTDGESYTRYSRVVTEDAGTIKKVLDVLKQASEPEKNWSRHSVNLSGVEARLTLVGKSPLRIYRCRIGGTSALALNDNEIYQVHLPDAGLMGLLREIANDYAKLNPADVHRSDE